MTSGRSRKWLRISIRTMLIVVFAVAVVLAWQTKRARDVKEAVGVFEELGGTIWFDYSYANMGPRQTPFTPRGTIDSEPWAGLWIRHLVGDYFFVQPIAIALSKTPVTDDDLEYAAKLPLLETVALGGTGISDDGLAHLHGLKRLQAIGIERTKVTDKGVEKFMAAQPNCRVSR